MSQFTLDDFSRRILSVLLPKEPPFHLHEPQFMGKEWEYVKSCIDQNWVSSAGQYVDDFERKLETYTGAKHAISVVNGTAALHTALTVMGVAAQDEVLIPSLTFIATANAVSYCGAVPHFIEVSTSNLGICPEKLADYLKKITKLDNHRCINKLTGRTLKAIIPMHAFGHPVDMDPLLELCQEYHIEVIEDAAESLGSHYKGKHTGTLGTLGVLSFNGNKILTTGGGGAILTNDDKLASRAKHLSTTAKLPHAYEYIHDEIGFNYRMPNINAALGCAQLEYVGHTIEHKRKLAHRYQEALKDIEGIQFLEEPEHTQSNYWLNTVIFESDKINVEKDTLLNHLHSKRIMSRLVWKPLHLLTMYQNCPRMDLKLTEQLSERIINLPSSVWLVRE